MSQQINRNKAEDTIEQNKIAFDKQLMQRKKMLIEEFIRSQYQQDQGLANYPNQILKRLAESQIKQDGKIHLYKNTTTVYFGQTCNELYHGCGLLIYRSNNIRFYQGAFQNNCKYGYGLQYINGDVYIGRFINNKPEDSNGIFIWTNEDIYHGSFINGMKHGQGKWQSGDQFYSGTWKFNKPQGLGNIKSALSEYNGQVKNGYKHGKGLQLFSNGDRYDGYYSNGKPQGKGTYCWNNGSLYKGDFKNGLRFGYGVWQYGAQKYQGTYINDKRNGQGTYSWGGGCYYLGQFVQDLRHGIGEMHWEEGSFYKGQWFEGTQNGMGQIWDKGKIIQKGFYDNGKLKIDPSEETGKNVLSADNSIVKKSVTPKNGMFPVFKQRKRFNSYQANKSVIQQQKKKPERHSQLEIVKKNENKSTLKKQESKRYSVLEKLKEKKGFSELLKPKEKRSSIQVTKLAKIQNKSKEKEQIQSKKNSLAKIHMQRQMKKQQKSESFAKRVTIPKITNNFDKQAIMVETQLSPINWKNFTNLNRI